MSTLRMTLSPKLRFALLIALVTLVFALLPLPVSAATITVDADCSLADAITAANTNTATGGCDNGSVLDTIVLTANITLSATLPSITSRIKIEGENFEISGGDSYQIFQVSSTGDLTIEELTLSEGSTSDDGGAIEVSGGDLTVYDSVFMDNYAGDDGGAIFAGDTFFDQGSVEIDRSVFDNNESGDDGGAIRVFQIRFDIDESRFTNNTSGGRGGAIDLDSHYLTIRESVFQGNSSDSDGGAIWISSEGQLDVSRSIFVQNSSDSDGGAIGMDDSADDLDIQNSTFSNNTADSRGSAILIEDEFATFSDFDVLLEHVTMVGNSSETLFEHYDSGTVEVENSILYNLGSGAACAGGFDDNVNTIIEDGACGNPASLSVNPLLGEFTNGYYPLLPGSPAINAAVSRCLRIDQRGVSRPQGGGCDIGAYEFGNGSSASSSTSRPQPATGRAQTKNEQTVAHNDQMIDEHGYGVTTQYGLQTIALQPLDPMDCGAIGSQAVCDMDVVDVVDVTGHVVQGIRFCFPQHGQVLFMPSHDENGQPINQKTAQPETLPVEIIDGMTCVTINRTGKLVLVYAEPPTIITQTQQESAPVWEPVPVTQCGHQTQADGSVVHVVQSGHHCWAIAEACGIYVEDIQQLNPGFGDCRMLHPGDELVVSAPRISTEAVSLSAEEIPYDDPAYMAMEERVSLGVARCMRHLATDHRGVTFEMVKRETRKIAEEAWRNRDSDHWTAQLGDGRQIVGQKWRRARPGSYVWSTQYPPLCDLMSPDLDWTIENADSEPLEEETLEELRQAIAVMLRTCDRQLHVSFELRYALVEREAPKVALAAFRDGVRDIGELPAYRAMGLSYRIMSPDNYESEAAKPLCFVLPDDSYLTDWGDHGDKDQLYNEQQIEEAEARFEAIKEWGVAACDIAVTAGASGAVQAGIASEEFAIELAKTTLEEVAKLAVKTGAAELSEASVDEKASVREQIAADFWTKALKLFPTGPCSFVVNTLKYDQLLAEMVQALANLEAGVDVDDLEVFGEDIQCEIYSTNTVLAKRDPDPNKDASELRLDATDTFSPLATVEHNGEKYYVVLGTSGSGTQVVGGYATAALYNNSENHGHAFVPVSAIDATDSCNDLPDVTSLYTGAARPQDLIGRELVDLNIQYVPDAYSSEDCKFKLVASESEETKSADFTNVFMLCETYEGASCKNLADDNEFVITHYDRRTSYRQVYVKSLDDDGKPEGWLKRKDTSLAYIPGPFGIRRLDQTRITEQWIDPYHFNPENVTEGSEAYGNTAMCLPQ